MKLAPQYYVRDGVPEHEWPTGLEASIAEYDRQAAEAPPPPLPRIDPRSPIGSLWICTRTVENSSAGPCPQGRVVLADDPVLAIAPEAFIPLLDTLGGGPVNPLMVKAI